MGVLIFPVFPELSARTEYRSEKVGSPNLPNGPKTGVQSGLTDARVIIENYRRYFFEERLHGALGYVPPREFKEQWLAGHPDFCMGALPPAPGI